MNSLQFQKAEFLDNTPSCRACKSALAADFFQFGGQNIWSPCAEKVRVMKAGPTPAAMTKGLLYGAGAAVGCFIAYSVLLIAMHGAQFGLIAIAIGYAIGYAIRQGTGGLGGRRCQLPAVVLTYCAMTFSIVPLGIQQFMNQPNVKRDALANKITVGSPAFKAASLVGVAAGLVVLALIAPFVSLTTGISGIIGLAILFFGMQRAWMLTASPPHALTGPFRREEAAVG